MPPTILHNIVEDLVSKLRSQNPDLTIPDAVVRTACEQYRISQIKIPPSMLSKTNHQRKKQETNNNHPGKRAAAILEWVYRTHASTSSSSSSSSATKLDWSILAKAIQVKHPQSIAQLQHILLNYLQPNTIPSSQSYNNPIHTNNNNSNNKDATTAMTTTKRTLRNHGTVVSYNENIRPSTTTTSTGNGSTAVSSSSLRISYIPNILPDLILRLSGRMVDPHRIQQHTRSLLEFLYHHPISGSSLYPNSYADISTQRGHVYDLQRYGPAYEAAALYHTIQQTQQQSMIRTKRKHSNSMDPEESDDEAGRMVPERKKQIKSRNTERWNKKDDECLSMDEEEETGDGHSRMETSDSRHSENNNIIGSSSSSSTISPITVEDILQAHPSSFTYLEFQQVLPRIRQVAILYKQQQQQKQQSLQQSKKRTIPSKHDSNNKQTPSVMIHRSRENRSTIDNTAEDLARNENTMVPTNEDEVWESKRRRILEQACEPFRPWNHMAEAIPKAAKAILLKYDIILPKENDALP